MSYIETSRQARRFLNREAVQEFSLGFQPQETSVSETI